jgi:TatD DNase family protein
MIDTHCHLYLKEFSEDWELVHKRAINAGVKRFFLPAIDMETHEDMLAMEKFFPDTVFAMIGLHPCSVNENYRDELQIVEQWLERRSFIAIGEAGLDFYWDKSFVKEQHEALQVQMEWAIRYGRPIVLHTREAVQETIDVVKPMIPKGLRGVFHCFSGTVEEAKQIIDMDFYLGIGGVVTFKNAGLDKVIQEIGLAKVVLETDAPYLAPVPHRGKRNESAYLGLVADKLSSITGMTREEVDRITTENAEALFLMT